MSKAARNGLCHDGQPREFVEHSLEGEGSFLPLIRSPFEAMATISGPSPYWPLPVDRLTLARPLSCIFSCPCVHSLYALFC